jgi:hypothetical protein
LIPRQVTEVEILRVQNEVGTVLPKENTQAIPLTAKPQRIEDVDPNTFGASIIPPKLVSVFLTLTSLVYKVNLSMRKRLQRKLSN